MSRFNSPLDHVRVAAPCSADWDHMIGNDRARFCGQCNLNVYNLSSMTKSEAESFIAGSEGRLCVRFYRRFDGSILTENCPVGLRKIRRRLSAVTRAITSAALSFFAGLGMQEGLSSLGQAARPRTMGQLLREPERLPVIADPPAPVRNQNQFDIGRVAVPRDKRPLPNERSRQGKRRISQ